MPDVSPFLDIEHYPYFFIIKQGQYYYYLCQVSKQPVLARYNNDYVFAGSSDYSIPVDIVMYSLITYNNASPSWVIHSRYSQNSQRFWAYTGQEMIYSNFDLYYGNELFYPTSPLPVDPNAPPPCPNTDANCDNICDDCGELLSMEYWSTALEYMVTTGYGLISKNIFDKNPHFFCVIWNSEDKAPELITSRTAFTTNSYGDVLLCENPALYKLTVNDDGSFSHYLDSDVSSTSEGIYIDPNKHDPLRFLYSNVTIQRPEHDTLAFAFAYDIEYDPFGGGETVGGGADRAQIERFDIDIDTYNPVGGLPADPEYGSGRVDVVVSPSAPPVSVPISPTSPVPTPDPSDPVVTPSPDPSEPNSIIIQNQITNIGENIAALPEKLGDKIAGAIKGLFVPSENDFIAIRLKWNLLLEERFGAVYESTAIIDSIVDTFQYSGDMSSIKFPAVTVDLAGTPFTFGGWDVEVIPESFKFLVSSVKLIVSIVCTVLFVNAMRKKLEGLVNR